MLSPAPVLVAPPGGPARSDDFGRAAGMLHRKTGIVLGTHKRDMVQRRLEVCASKLGLPDASAYLDMLERDTQSPQWECFVNAFTINHTAFFRESHHFDMLARYVSGRNSPVSVWSCACSTGEEAYSIAMTLCQARTRDRDDVSVLATDIDTQAISHAQQGIYSSDRTASIPSAYLASYFLRGRGRHAGSVRVKPSLQAMIAFDRLNLLSPQWPDQTFDAIFCRNTMIYFDKPTQSRIIERFAERLKPEGLLFAGHSENFTYLTKSFCLLGKTVYRVRR